MGKLIDLSGQRFGFWMVLKRTNNSKSGQTQWICKCDCGIKKSITANSLKSCNSTSCGCNNSEDLKGKTFGNLTVKKADYSKGRKCWLCKCICGKKVITGTDELKSKKITSCSSQICLIDNGGLYKLDKLITENIVRLLFEFKELSIAREEINKKQEEISENIRFSIKENKNLQQFVDDSQLNEFVRLAKLKCLHGKNITEISQNLCTEIKDIAIID